MDGFTITCNKCRTQSEFEKEDERVSEDIKILNHFSGVRFVCTKCGQQLVLE